MAGIYIHIPFCKKKCYYCDFFTQIGLKYKEDFLRAILLELEQRKNYLESETVESIYFGGGTPSLLSSDEIKTILEKIYKNFNISEYPEITLEVNPDDITVQYLTNLKYTGINRISIGIQSFFDDDLVVMNRRHTAEQAHRSVEQILSNGFTNLSGDLIYGLPNSDACKWSKNLKTFFDLKIPHLSAYHLSYEQNTVFSKLLKTGKLSLIDEENSLNQFSILCDESRKRGYEHYEISNFALHGFISLHNSAYWRQKSYLGIGPSAHSYNCVSRSWNISDFKKYLEGIFINQRNYQHEILSESDRYNEYIITSLRTHWGVNFQTIEENFGKMYSELCLNKSKKYIQNGNLMLNNNILNLTQEGKFISDKIIEDLFYMK